MKRLVLTFDDGVRSHYDRVRPLLLQHGLTGTFFIPGVRSLWLHPKTPLNMREDGLDWSEIRDLHEAGFEVASHTWNHLPLIELTRKTIQAEINDLNEEFVKRQIPVPVSLCYPGYWCNDAVLKAVRETGIQYARTGYIRGDLLPNKRTRRPELRHFVPGVTDPLCIYSTGILNDEYTVEDFIADLEATPDDGVAVFTAHGFQQSDRWEEFQRMVKYVVDRGYQTMTMRDLPV